MNQQVSHPIAPSTQSDSSGDGRDRFGVPNPEQVSAGAGTSLLGEWACSMERGVLITVISRVRVTLPRVSEDSGGGLKAPSPKPALTCPHHLI